jgi:tRNA (guanine26-N2/guanine27-N2)-dimethyltransferase
MGYVEHCPACGGFATRSEPRWKGTCEHCRSRTFLAGPLWLGRISEPDVIRGALAALEGGLRARRLLEVCLEEENVPMYYDHHNICERLKITPARIDDIVRRLCAEGYRASRTHFSGLGIKTDAPLKALEEAAKPA